MIERLDHFMARANALYYANHDPFDDFVTSPEISQVFGEILGLWAGQVWTMVGAPSHAILLEAGPGRGTLLIDALAILDRALPAFSRAISIHLIETSPRLAAALQTKLPGAQIHRSFDDIPGGPLILLANEFLDALPIRQFVRRETGWVERYVANGAFVEYMAEIELPPHPVGTVLERNEAAAGFVNRVAGHIMRHNGAALFIDYGPARSGPGDTLQAIRQGQSAPPLTDPGTADLTAHVDFEALGIEAAGTGCAVAGPIAQGAFLAALGVHERTAQLGRHGSPDDAFRLLAATQRLTAPEAMGSLFKAFSFRHPGLPALPGFSQ